MYLTTRLNTMPGTVLTPDRLSSTFAALADPTRRAILARLASGEISVTELAEPFKMSLPAVSKRVRSSRLPTGSRPIADFGKRVSIVWKIICAKCRSKCKRRRKKMAATASNAAAIPTERELVITRIFDAPRKVVYQAWADPERAVKWLGPKGFTGKIIKMDARPGGSYRFYMRDPQGGDHWQQGVFREIVENERIVQTYAWADAEGNPTLPETLLTVTFEDHGAKTRLT